MIDESVILKRIDELAEQHPYKVQGQPDTYSAYNEAWCDALDAVRAFVDGELQERHTAITILDNMRRAILNGVPLDSPCLRVQRAEALDRAIAAISKTEKE